ncbi:MAG: prepilin-type N-terminal cleavage/methylation domain-containing protein [Phycisphaerae bacterium]|nr:prepilin-type N-terminal cleavage/methylation domain-containing protein [Phycisphaerae bacterium]
MILQNRSNHKRQNTAFTLIELLVVIAIISLLVAILLPSLQKAKDLAKSSVCTTQLHAQHLAFMFYGDDNAEKIFDGYRQNESPYNYDGDWPRYLAKYFDLPPRDYNAPDAPSWGSTWTRTSTYSAFTCPGVDNPAKSTSYSINYNLLGNYSGVDYDTWRRLYWHMLNDEGAHSSQTLRMGDTGDFVYIDVGLCRYYNSSDQEHAYKMMSRRHMDGGNYLFCDGHIELVSGEWGNWIWTWTNSNNSLSLDSTKWNN